VTDKEAFLGAVENVVARCFIPVPSAPLMALSEAVDSIAADLDVQSRTMEADALLYDVFCAAEDLDWSFWPETDYGGTEALISISAIQSLADALHAYREAEKERP